jgi:zinc/manganese transport system ATP-binding protein
MAGSRLGQYALESMITLENLTVSYRQHPALHHVSGTFAEGSLTAVIGPNGAGKSTWLKSIVGSIPKTTGSLKVSTPNARVAYLPQLAEIDRSFPINVQDCVMLGFWSVAGAARRVTPTMLGAIEAALKTVGLEGFEARPVGTLSSGQLQRVMFARLLVQDAQLILLDEPFNAVDSRTTQALLPLVSRWHQEQRTVIAVIHDDAQVREFFPQTLLLAREVIAWGPTADVLQEEHLSKARFMAEVWDEDAHACHATSAELQAVAA